MDTTRSYPTALLSTLLERHYIPDCCRFCSSRYLWSLRATVEQFSADLRRPATTADFTREAIEKFAAHLRHARYPVAGIRERRKRLRTLWGYAHRLGLASPPETIEIHDRPVALAFTSTKERSELDDAFDVLRSPAAAGTVRWLFLTVYRPQKLADKAPKTIEGHLTALRSHWLHYKRDLELSEQSDTLAAEHFRWMKENGQTNFAVNHVRKCWFAQWRLAAERGLVNQWPTLRGFKTGTTPPDAWTIDEMQRLLAAANYWWRAILLVGYWTLQRRRALLEIPIENVDLDGGWIDFPPSAVKTLQGIRCRIGPDAVAAIRVLPKPKGGYLFRKGLKQLGLEFQALLRKADIAPSKRMNGQFHKLRRTGATHAAARGGMSVVCDLLGHSSVYVTKFYIDKSQLSGHDVTRLLPVLIDDEHTLSERNPQ